jgi:LytS/YehU family sensor histidine kinase
VIGALRRSVAARPGRWGWVLTVVFCLAIALFLTAIGGGDLRTNLVASHAIGLSIHGSVHLARRLLPSRTAGIFGPALGLCVGLALGLVLAGALLYGEPRYYLAEDSFALAVGVMFGAIGTAAGWGLATLHAARSGLADARAEALAREKTLAEAELRALQAQTEPHFLFNTLSNVASLVDVDPVRARQLVERLTALLRRSLDRTRSGATTLEDELEVIRDYLEIQALRMGGRLRWCMEVAPELGRAALPPLLIQPLVENAVLHALEPAAAGGRIEIRATRDERGRLRIVVDDDGVGLGQGSGGAGTGLANVRERLRALYGADARLSVAERAEGGVRATVLLPAGGEP